MAILSLPYEEVRAVGPAVAIIVARHGSDRLVKPAVQVSICIRGTRRAVGGKGQDLIAVAFVDDYEVEKLENDLILSDEDDHWSPKANKWIFDNYILPKVVDILSQMRRG